MSNGFYKVISSFLALLFGLTLFQSKAIAEVDLVCFMSTSSGQVVDLTELCSRKEKQNLNSEMEAKTLSAQGMILAQRGLFQEAITSLNQAISVNSDYVEAYTIRGSIRFIKGDKQGSLADFERAAALYVARGKTQNARLLQQRIAEIQQEL